MRISELTSSLQNLNIGKITNKKLAEILLLDEATFCRKKKRNDELSYEQILKVEKFFKINLSPTGQEHSNDSEDDFTFLVRKIVRDELKTILQDIIKKI